MIKHILGKKGRNRIIKVSKERSEDKSAVRKAANRPLCNEGTAPPGAGVGSD